MSKGTCGVVLVLLVAAASFVPAQDATTVALPAPAPESRIEKPSRGVSIPTLSLEFAPNTPAEFAKRLRNEVEKYAQIVKQSGARVD